MRKVGIRTVAESLEYDASVLKCWPVRTCLFHPETGLLVSITSGAHKKVNKDNNTFSAISRGKIFEYELYFNPLGTERVF